MTSGESSAEYNEFLESIPIAQHQENLVSAESMALAFEFIAVVLFDKAFTARQNPLRAEGWIHLDQQIHAFLELLKPV